MCFVIINPNYDAMHGNISELCISKNGKIFVLIAMPRSNKRVISKDMRRHARPSLKVMNPKNVSMGFAFHFLVLNSVIMQHNDFTCI